MGEAHQDSEPVLTKFWGHPMYIGAIVLLPKGYDEHPNAHYPVIYDRRAFQLERAVWIYNRE